MRAASGGRNGLSHVPRRGATPGRCPICVRRTLFYAEGGWLRDQLRCPWCYSIPRWRALVPVMETEFPCWRTLRIHESSPGGAASEWIARECTDYRATFWWPDVTPGTMRDGVRCENLEAQTFDDAAFDLVVTQDVLGHTL